MNMKWIRFALPAAAVTAAGAFFTVKKLKSKDSKGPGSASGKARADAAPAAPQSVRNASYSFISGFKDAATVEVNFSYDPDHFDFSVVEDDFPAESGDSHVGVLHGEAFSAQFEYGSYFSGEDFARLRQELSRKHADLSDAVFGPLSGVKYRDGDSLCLAFPIPEDEHSYLLVTLLKASDNDDELEALPDYPDLRFMLSSLSFRRT